ncbi:MAG: SDR family NAD(P)-dependent oxidoreductase, partial [Actinobacteria bacterium]|nr:SDR family NAD(P)-dependent oxidoreductase [Actinomycetota bacterium]
SKGFLVNISGMVAATPMPGMAAYSASKAAAAAGLAALRKELRRAGVLVCDVQPPHTETGLATRPLAGTAPRLPQGLEPEVVAERIVAAIEADQPLVSSTDFG